MATLNPIILGGGIAAGSPFTLGSLLRIVNVTPPTAADSIVFQRTQAATEVITVGTPWVLANTFTEKLQVVGGFISDTGASDDNSVMGRAQTVVAVDNARNVVLGHQAQCNALDAGAAANTSLNVVITPMTLVGAGNGLRVGVGSCVLIGPDVLWGASFPGGSVVAIGSAVNLDVAATGPIVGAGAIGRGQGAAFGNLSGAQGNFNNWCAFGHSANINAANAMALGDGSQSSFATSIALGRNAATLVANQLVVGGANLEINNVLIGGGDTAAVPTSLTWRNTDGSGADVPGGIMTVVASRGTGNAATQGQVRFQTGTPGAAGVALQAAATRLEILPAQSAAGASINFVATNSPGAAAGTLLNAPTAGNPEWVPVLFNGALRFMPVWP